jgi:hypothetical protein
VLLLISALFLTACKVDLTQEIWLNKDNSGKALIQADVSYINFSSLSEEVGADTTMSQINVLQDYIDMITNNKSVSLISSEIIDNSNADESKYTHKVLFSFQNLRALNDIIALPDQKAVAGSTKELKIYPPQIAMISAGELEEPLGDVSMFEINYHLNLHSARKIKNTKNLQDATVDGKNVRWDFAISQEWFDSPTEEITLKF